MKCLACWEEIKEFDRICHHCGSDQKEVKDYFVLALLKQQKRKIVVPEETDVLQYILEVDPESRKEITITGSSEPLPPYQPIEPSLALTSQGQSQPEPMNRPSTLKALPSKTVEKTLICPSCLEEVPYRKFCKFCGYQLQKECDNCGTINRTAAKFCTKCGQMQKASESDGEEQITKT
ncbi:MAG: zinc ribbon domain-containing protein [Candidatus Heimdallarchaeota archaeon]|nr:zinc ribbon domain-containing protein [Candidatus Heimdallarchaeota archaeon]